MGKALWAMVSAVVAFLAFAWVYKGDDPYVSLFGETAALMASAVCVGCLLGSIVGSYARRRWVSIVTGLLWGFGVIFLSVWWPHRGIDYLSASMLPGYLVGIAALVLGIRALHWGSQGGRGAHILLAVLGLAVLVGLIDLDIRPSPERTVRRFARSSATYRWKSAYALLSPELQQSVRQGFGPLAEHVQAVLREPKGVILRRLDVHGPVAEAQLFCPRGPLGHDAGFGRFDYLTLAKDDSGQWLISGTGGPQLLRHLEETHPRE